MALTRGRVIGPAMVSRFAKTVAAEATDPNAPRVIRKEIVEARDDAAKIVAEARREAERIVEEARNAASEARDRAVREGREEGAATLAAAWITLRKERADDLARREGEVVAIARALAERVLGRALEDRPELIVDLARSALSAAQRARRVTLFVHPDDAEALRAGLPDLGLTATHLEVQLDPSLSRGSLRAHTDLGALDADLPLQLDRLARALAGR